MQRALDDGAARRDAESRGRHDHQAAVTDLGYKRAQALGEDMLKMNHQVETLRRDGDAKSARLEVRCTLMSSPVEQS